MHGYFIDMKLYNRLRTVSEPFAYEEYRKRRIREKVSSNSGDYYVSIGNYSASPTLPLGPMSPTHAPLSHVWPCGATNS